MFCKELGNTGVQIPEIGIGTWEYHAGPETLRKGLDAGALFIDTAESYGTEPVVAEAIADAVTACFWPRKFPRITFGARICSRPRTTACAGCRATILICINSINRTMPFPSRKPLARWRSWWTPGKCGLSASATFSGSNSNGAAAMRKYRIVSNQVRYQPY